jgi:hypothetical protein
MNAHVRVLPDAVVMKVTQALDAQENSRSDAATRRAVAGVLAMLRSRNVLYADLDNEIWQYVFASLHELRSAFAETYAQLIIDGPPDVTSLVDLMVTATREYLARFEASYVRHMGDMPSDRSLVVWEREWPERQDASLGLIALREVLVGAIERLNAFALPGERVDVSSKSPVRVSELSEGLR